MCIIHRVSPWKREGAVPVCLGAGWSTNALKLELSSAFVGGGRAVVVLERNAGLGNDPIGTPLSASMLDGDRVVCSRQSAFGGTGPGQDSPLLVVDCPMRPTERLALRLAAGVDTVRLDARLHD
jgi:hypothetical protein